MNDYLLGCHVLGAEKDPPPTDVLGDEGPFVTIHIKDLQGVAKAKGGSVGGIAAGLLPQTVGSLAYSKMATQIKDKMKEQGVDADVQVVQNKPPGGPFRRDLLFGTFLGLSLAGVGYGLIKLIAKMRRK